MPFTPKFATQLGNQAKSMIAARGGGFPWQSVLGAVGGIGGGILGLLGGNLQANRQLRTNQQLIQQQLAANKEQMMLQKQLDLEMWEKTGYKAQMEQMKAAGLNPALMYGMGGGGGQTVGNSGGGVSQPNVIPMDISGISQMAKTVAEIGLIKAQTEKTKEETTNEAGGVRQNLEATFDNIIAATDNTKAKTRLTEFESDWQELQNSIAEESKQETLSQIRVYSQLQANELAKLVRENAIGQATYFSSVLAIVGNAVQVGLRNKQIIAETKLTDAERDAIPTKLSALLREVTVSERNAATNEKNASTQSNLGAWQEGLMSKQMDDIRKKVQNSDMTDSEKQIVETILGVAQAGILKGAGRIGNQTNPIGFRR